MDIGLNFATRVPRWAGRYQRVDHRGDPQNEGSVAMSTDELIYRVSQAQGMVSVQTECTLNEALVIMQERAVIHHQTLADIADAVLEHRIRFGP